MLLLALLVSLPSASAAQVITFNSAVASWRDAQDNVPGNQPGDPVITNGVPTSSISWGGATPQSGYDVTITIPDPTQFPVADFTHRNFTVPDPSLTSVVLDIVIDFDVDGIPFGPLTFTFTFTHEETPNNLDPCPYPTPPGEGCTDRVTFLDAPLPTTFTVGGKTYTLGMTFLDGDGDPVEEFITSEGGVANTAELDVEFTLVPPVFEVTKSGPATLAPGQNGIFTIDARNTGPNDAFDTTLRDLLPDGATGGLCDATPQVLSAQVFQADGSTPVPGKGPLLQGADFDLAYSAAPDCELSLTMSSAAAVVGEDERLIVRYQTQLDGGSQFGVALTNVAGATEWFDDDDSNPIRGSYTEVLGDGTVGLADHQDAHTVNTAPLDYLFEKTVVDPASGALLATANPGDTIRYRLRLENRTAGPLVGLGFTDEIDRLNGSPLFEPGSLTLVTVPAGADVSGTDPSGGVARTGLVDVRDLTVAAGESVLVEFDVTLENPIADGTLVTDQAELLIADVAFGLSDDPGVNGVASPFVADDEDPTVLTIASLLDFQVEKVSADLDGDPAVLLAGERLRYTITVANVGNADAEDAVLRDAIPVNTRYLAGSTRLNGQAVADAGSGVAPFVDGLPIYAPGDPTPGTLPADPAMAAENVATLEFDVVVEDDVVDGTVISNQAFVSAIAGGVVDQPSDDPDTAAPDDPTRDVVGALPLLFASKSVEDVDGGTVQPDDVLHYTVTVYNNGVAPATGVSVQDDVPADTSYVEDSLTVDGVPFGRPDGGLSPLVAGVPIGSPDLGPGESATLEFDLMVDSGAAPGTLISNQANVTSDTLPDLPTDGDGDPATGPEPTVVVVGDGQQLAITKQVTTVGGGPALAGSEVEYVVRVTNFATVPADSVVITDDLDAPLAGQLAYVPGSATLNGAPDGITVVGSLITADYQGTFGPLEPGATAILRFRATLDGSLAMGTTVTNTGVVTWDDPAQTAMASVSFDVGGMPGVATLNGSVWLDADFDRSLDAGELGLGGWTVELLRDDQPIRSVETASDGSYRLTGLAPNDTSSERYALRFRAPDAGPRTASLGRGESPFTNGPQEILEIVAASGSNLQGLDLPVAPNGVVYDAVLRGPVARARVSMRNAATGVLLPAGCFDDPVQQDQITRADGWYKFDLNFSAPDCPAGGDYLIEVQLPGDGFVAGPSEIVPPDSDATTPPFSVPACPGSANDAVAATAQHCEAQASLAPPGSGPAAPAGDFAAPTAAGGLEYYLHLTLDDSQDPGSSQIFNNHIAVDPVLDQAVSITKTTPSINVSRGDLVPYEITVTNEQGVRIPSLGIVDTMPAGFRYVEKSARINGKRFEPEVDGRRLTWRDVGIGRSGRKKLVLLLAVGAGVGEGEHRNRAQAIVSSTGSALSGEASATVRVVPDPTFACTDVLGKVFDDANRNGTQEFGEKGLPGVRLVTVRGLVATTDAKGRFHITCALVPREDRGSNFMLKLDDRSLPSGYRMSTRTTQVKRATQGKALRFRFGASIHRVVAMDVADPVFEPGTARMRAQWRPRIGILVGELRKAPAILRLSYLADVEPRRLVDQRLEKLKQLIEAAWAEEESEPLEIETEVYWRRGAPVDGAARALPDVSAPPRAPATTGPPAVSAGPPAREVAPGHSIERNLPVDESTDVWAQDPEEIGAEAGDRLEQREVVERKGRTVKLKDLVPPVRFESGEARIAPGTVGLLRSVIEDMRELRNVRLNLVGHTDDRPLSDTLARLYGDNAGLSRERAGEVAEYLQGALGLPPEALSFEWAGDSQPVASNATEQGRALNRRVEIEVWYDEIEEETSLEEFVVQDDIKRVKVCRVETVCKLRYREGHAYRARVRNLVAPLRLRADRVGVPDDFVEQIRQALTDLRDKTNVTVKFIGHTDDAPLSERDQRIYGTHLALSKARARRVALAVRDALDLPSSAVASDGFGSSRSIASNDRERGRALNRRIEVEFWHDDPLQQLPDEPQLCPDAAGAETVTRVYDPPWGRIDPIRILEGRPVVPRGQTDQLRFAMGELSDKANVRLRFVGYTGNERLDRRTALAYGDDIGLSTSRARRAKEQVQAELGLDDTQVEHEGRGYVHSNDVVNAGFVQDRESFVQVQVVYDELAVIDDREGIEVTPITRELRPQEPLALNLMRITVDGVPIDDPGRSSADIQRCTDVALERADIQFKFDGLEVRPRLSVSSDVSALPIPGIGEATATGAEDGAAEGAAPAGGVRFRMYTNYGHFIERSEVRIFDRQASLRSEPLAVVALDDEGDGHWLPEVDELGAPRRELQFLLRAYDAEGRFDETKPQTLWLVRGDGGLVGARPAPAQDDPRALLAGYGEAEPVARNIPLGDAGTVRVQGAGIPGAHRVWVAGNPIPVDGSGRFVAETLVPSGLHTVEVAVLDPEGNGELFLRDLELDPSDWFYMGIADVTLSAHHDTGRKDDLEGKNAPYDTDSMADGRLAFYLNGRFGDGWKLVASADTREDEITNIFSNFMDKSPDALFRRIDPDYHYPTFGDDGTVDETAPTSGKLFARLSKDESHAMWGNFKVGYLENELAQVDRGLYGANLHYQTLSTTGTGEQRLVVDGYAAKPGTVASREEFRGTGGSLYFLRRQDVMEGSERLRVEVRDKDTGIVVGVVDLQPDLDYDIDYLQGRILLARSLSAIVDDGLLVRSQGLSGNEAWLVVRYEYSPDFDDLDAMTFGGQAQAWLTDFLKVGATASRDKEGANTTLYGGDVTLRATTDSWLKLQVGRSEGIVSTTVRSDDGGFRFMGAGLPTLQDTEADAYRADLSVGFGDLFEGFEGRLSLYAQRLEAGYSAPGQNAVVDTDQYGGRLDVDLTEQLQLLAKADRQTQDQGLDLTSGELDVSYDLTEHWRLSTGVRYEDRTDDSPFVAATQEEGERADGVVQVAFDPQGRWSGYGFGQTTLLETGDRESNLRYGVGGAFRVSDALALDGEVSNGDLGPAVQLGMKLQQTEQTERYLSYSMDTERGASGLQRRTGTFVSGVRSRLSDSGSVYQENRYQRSDSANGLTRSMGFSFAPDDQWTLGGNWEYGTLIDRETLAETDRNSGGGRVAFGNDWLRISSGVEYRSDDSKLPDGSRTDRTTWLFRNSARVQVTPGGRVVGQFNHSFSDSSEGQFYDGGFTEAVVGFAYRPVAHDRLNVLTKYTYFYNVPNVDQVVLQDTAVQFIQRSHVASIDVSYDLTRWLTLGAKYAFRRGEVSLDREDEKFFDNDAHLYILRGDVRFLRHWETSLEGRLLDLPDLDETRGGALVTLYRYLGKNLKLGVGYNFTDFSDDLTDYDYGHHGWFLNIVGTL
ncbi:MAG: OmpA family protein [Myxococcota bacterium]